MKRKPWVVYPVLFALYPVLSLYSHNVTEVEPAQLVWPALALVSGVMLAWLVLWGLVRNLHKAALLATVGVLFVFAFLGLKETVGQALAPLVHLNAARVTAILLIAGFSVMAYFLLRTRRQVATATPFMNWLGILFVLVPLICAIPRLGFHVDQRVLRTESWPQASPAPQNKPDIYYIIVDAYGRQDILNAMYGIDNSKFLTWLEQTGFQVIKKSHSNYCQTILSLNSSLGCTYLDEFALNLGNRCIQTTPLVKLLKHTQTVEYLRSEGYTFTSFASGDSATELHEADNYLAAPGLLGPFGQMLIDLTPIPSLSRHLGLWSTYGAHRRRISYTIDTLPEVASESGPKFVFAHLVCPHPPFVFAPDGTPQQPPWRYGLNDASDFMNLAGSEGHNLYREGYRDQVLFINRELELAVPQIIKRSTQPPIIILQGDHGPGNYLDWSSCDKSLVQERFGILNAVLLPGPDAPRLPEDASPVNTFRLILRHYFGLELDPLPNRCYYSGHPFLYDFIDVTDRLDDPIPAEYLAPVNPFPVR